VLVLRRNKWGRELLQVASTTSIAATLGARPRFLHAKFGSIQRDPGGEIGLAEIAHNRETFKGCPSSHRMEINNSFLSAGSTTCQIGEPRKVIKLALKRVGK
jgi:hypothetical protein